MYASKAAFNKLFSEEATENISSRTFEFALLKGLYRVLSIAHFNFCLESMQTREIDLVYGDVVSLSN